MSTLQILFLIFFSSVSYYNCEPLALLNPRNFNSLERRETSPFQLATFQFKSYNVEQLATDLGNNDNDPIGIYIADDYFMQINNLENPDIWSSIPYTDNTIQEIFTRFSSIEKLQVVSSTLRPNPLNLSGLQVISLENVKFVSGNLGLVLRKCSNLKELSTHNSGDLYISDLSPTIIKIQTRSTSILYATNVELNSVSRLELLEGTYVDPRIVSEFHLIFPKLQSIGLDQTYFELLKDTFSNTGGLKKLLWITIYRFNVALVKKDGRNNRFDELLLKRGIVGKGESNHLELVKDYKTGNWEVVIFRE